jgi:hypothetical protein
VANRGLLFIFRFLEYREAFYIKAFIRGGADKLKAGLFPESEQEFWLDINESAWKGAKVVEGSNPISPGRTADTRKD